MKEPFEATIASMELIEHFMIDKVIEYKHRDILSNKELDKNEVVKRLSAAIPWPEKYILKKDETSIYLRYSIDSFKPGVYMIKKQFGFVDNSEPRKMSLNPTEIFNHHFNIYKTFYDYSEAVFASIELKKINKLLTRLENSVYDEYNEKRKDQNDEYHVALSYKELLLSINESNNLAVLHRFNNENESDGIDYKELHRELKPHLNISLQSLKSLIAHGSVIPEDKTAIWIGTRADAYRFAYWLNPGDDKFKNRFNVSVTMEPPLHASDGQEKKGFIMELSGSIYDILKRYSK